MGGFIVLGMAFTLPYSSWYAAVYGSINPWEGGKTPLWAYFDIHGVFLFLLVTLLIWDTARWLRSVYVRDLRGTWPLLLSLGVAFLALMVGVVFLAIVDYQVALVAIPLLIWMLALFLRPGQSRAMQLLLILAGLAVGLTLGVEFIVVAGDIGRQNTVFKFYIQAWLLFSVVGGAAFAILWERADSWRGRWRYPWYTAAALLFAVAFMYPVMATRGRSMDRIAPGMGLTLDGMDYMQYAHYNENSSPFALDDDYAMIRWLQDNVQGDPVEIEAQSSREYFWSGRVAIYTGMPTVLGWRFHQTQQRTLDDMGTLINQRRSNINAFYATTDIPTALDMIRFYQIQYIIVGSLEKAYYPPDGLDKFERMAQQGLLTKVFSAW